MEAHRGTTILVLGVLGIVLCYICGPIAWVMANKDLAKMQAGQMDPSGHDQTKAGKICGIIGTVFLVLGVLFTIAYALIVGFAVANAGFSS